MRGFTPFRCQPFIKIAVGNASSIFFIYFMSEHCGGGGGGGEEGSKADVRSKF